MRSDEHKKVKECRLFRFFKKIILFYGIYINIVCVVDARDKQIISYFFSSNPKDSKL